MSSRTLIDQPDTLTANTLRLVEKLHAGSNERFLQNITDKKRETKWFSIDDPLIVPKDWLETGNVYIGVHGTTVRITEQDRKKTWAVGKADRYIERFVASKNGTIAAVNSLYAEFDGKDFTSPTEADIDAHFQALRSDPKNAKLSEKALRNQAKGKAKSAAYKLDPAKHLAMAKAHVDQLTPAPSVIVKSGGGFQCYWFLTETLTIRTHTDDQAAHIESFAKDLQERWVSFVGGDLGAKDLRRILRLPGTYNHKPAYGPNFPLVSFVRADFDLLYSVDALAHCLPAPVPPEDAKTAQKPARSPRQPTEAHTDASETAALDLATLQAKGDSLIAVFNANVRIRDILRDFGYGDKGERMSRPGGEDASIVIDTATNRSQHWSSNDPLYDPHWQTPFSVFCRLQHAGDFAAARKALIDAIFPAMRMWARTTSFEDHIPNEFKKLNQYGNLVYLGDPTDTKVLVTMTGIYEKTCAFGAVVSKRIGGRTAGVGANTFVRSLQRMANFFEVTVTPDHLYYVRLKWENVVFTKWTTYSQLKNTLLLGGPSTANDKNTPEIDEYSPRMAQEPFLIGTSKMVRERIQDIAKALDITPAQAKEEYTHPSLGESGLRAIDALRRCGEMTAAELASETGKKISAIRTAVRKLAQHGIVSAEREGPRGPKVYSLCDDVWAKVDEISPNLRTYGIAARRENKRLEAAQQWAQKGIVEAQAAQNTEQAQRLEHRFAKLAKQRIPQLQRLHPDLDLKDVERLAYEVAAYKRGATTPAPVRTARTQAQEAHRNEVRMIRDLAESFMDVDTPADAIYSHIMAFGTFDEKTVKAVLQSPRQMSKFETLADVRKRLEHDNLIDGLRMTPATVAKPGYTQPAMDGAA